MMPSHIEAIFNDSRQPIPGDPFNRALLLPAEMGRDIFAALSALPEELANGEFTALDLIAKTDPSMPVDEELVELTKAGLETLADSGMRILEKTDTGFKLADIAHLDLSELSMSVMLMGQIEQITGTD